jgi:hypothetical protein
MKLPQPLIDRIEHRQGGRNLRGHPFQRTSHQQLEHVAAVKRRLGLTNQPGTALL